MPWKVVEIETQEEEATVNLLRYRNFIQKQKHFSVDTLLDIKVYKFYRLDLVLVI
jgi:hypothetical protein